MQRMVLGRAAGVPRGWGGPAGAGRTWSPGDPRHQPGARARAAAGSRQPACLSNGTSCTACVCGVLVRSFDQVFGQPPWPRHHSIRGMSDAVRVGRNAQQACCLLVPGLEPEPDPDTEAHCPEPMNEVHEFPATALGGPNEATQEYKWLSWDAAQAASGEGRRGVRGRGSLTNRPIAEALQCGQNWGKTWGGRRVIPHSLGQRRVSQDNVAGLNWTQGREGAI